MWICAALIDDKAYLFDARLGLEIPGPDGTGVATLDDAMSDPAILERMNLPGQSPYGTSRASLLGSPTKIGILLDSSRGYFSPKMKLLQRELGGEYRTILFRDPADQRDHFAQVLGEKAGEIKLWSLPFEVETRLFNDGQFVASIQQSLFLFKREYPLIYARVKQLRGDLEGAINDYVKLRFKENAPLVNNKNARSPRTCRPVWTRMPPITWHWPNWKRPCWRTGHPIRRRISFRTHLSSCPSPGPSQPYYHMLRWGANANLGRIYEAKKDGARAIAYETQRDPTTQGHGNLLRARELVWRSPMAAPPVDASAAPGPGRSRRRRRIPPLGRAPFAVRMPEIEQAAQRRRQKRYGTPGGFVNLKPRPKRGLRSGEAAPRVSGKAPRPGLGDVGRLADSSRCPRVRDRTLGAISIRRESVTEPVSS